MESIKSVLECFNMKERQLVAFRYFIESEDNKRALYVLKNCIGTVNDVVNLYALSLIVKSQLYRTKKENAAANIFEYDYDYQAIVNKFVKLSRELDIKSSLELYTLYTYMLWKGYFSKDKSFQYSPDALNMLPEIASHAIMNGSANCLSVNSMLTDVFNIAGYNSAVLVVTAKGHLKGYCPPLKNESVEEIHTDYGLLRYNPKEEIMKELFGNHAVSLIGDEKGMYVCDAQNIVLHKLRNNNEARSFNGRHKLEIKPYLSYYLNDEEDRSVALTRFLTSSNYTMPCDEKQYEETWKKQLDNFRKNRTLLEDYYCDSKTSIDRVDEKVIKVKGYL